MHGHIVLIDFLAERGKNRVTRCRDGHSGTEHGVIAHGDHAVVHEGKVKVRVNVIAETYVLAAPVRVERRLDITVLADMREHAFQHCLALFRLGRTSKIVFVDFLQLGRLFGGNGIVVARVKFAGK